MLFLLCDQQIYMDRDAQLVHRSLSEYKAIYVILIPTLSPSIKSGLRMQISWNLV